MAPGAAAAAEIERAAKEASDIVACILRYPPDYLEVTDCIRGWHSSGLSLGEAYALLWQQDAEGGTVNRSSPDDSNARLCAAHLIDLILAGRIKLYWSSKTGLLGQESHKLRIMVASTAAASVPSTTAFLQYLNVQQEDRLKKNKNPIGLQDFLMHQISDAFGNKSYKLEEATFDDLVARGILTKEKKKAWLFLQTRIYPTNDPTPEALLVQDLRAVLQQEKQSTAHLELLLKLIAKTTKVFTPEEEAANATLKRTRKAFKHKADHTLLLEESHGLPTSTSDAEESPFGPQPELSV